MADAPFHLKDFNTLVQELILTARAHTERITDYNLGSVARTLLEAPALELDALYQAMHFGLLDAIPIALYEGFGFTALSACAASGIVTLTLASPALEAVQIPAGARLVHSEAEAVYQTQASATISIGQTTATVRIAATTTGALGNREAGELAAYHITDPAGLSGLTVANPQAIAGGREAETTAERRVRFIQYVQSLARGTLASLRYCASQGQLLAGNGLVMERVQRVSVEETAGHVNLYVWNGAGNTSAELCAHVQTLVDGYFDADTQQWIAGYRPAGMRVDVIPMQDVTVNVSIELDARLADQTTATRTAVLTALQTAIRSEPAQAQLRPVDLINSALTVPGILGARLITPTATIQIAPVQALTPGTLTTTWRTVA